MSKLLNVLALLVLGGLVGVVGWWTNHYRSSLLEQEADIVERDRRIEELKLNLEAQADALLEAEAEVLSVRAEKEALELRNKLLLLDHRLARVEVVNQRETTEGFVTEVRFIELGSDGKPIAEPKQVEVRGEGVFVDAASVCGCGFCLWGG